MEVLGVGSYFEAWTVDKVEVKCSSFVEVMGTRMVGVEAV